MEYDWEGLKAKLNAQDNIRNTSITVTREDLHGIPRPMSSVSDGIYPVRDEMYPVRSLDPEKCKAAMDSFLASGMHNVFTQIPSTED